MKHTMKALDNAVNFLLPNIKLAKDNGASFVRPDLLKMVAVQYFTSDTSNLSDKELQAYGVCKQALITLESVGCIKFGDKEWSAE